MRHTVRALLAAVAVALVATAGTPAAAGGLRRVTFTFSPGESYSHVFLAGTFNDWDPTATPMRAGDGAFALTIPLAEGEYQYKFVADGSWITDETAVSFHPDGYGGRNSVIVVDSSFEALALSRTDGSIMVDGLGHDEGAWGVVAGPDGDLTLRARAYSGDLGRVGLQPGEGAENIDMELFDSDGTYDYYEFTMHLAHLSSGVVLSYRFQASDGGTPVWFGPEGSSEDAGDVGWYEVDIDATLGFRTPDWVKEGVFYQIFPERFANGDPGNDPDFTESYYEGLTSLPPSGKTNGEYFHFVSDWYDVAGLERSPYRTDGRPDYYSFYGGDIEGVRQHIDYLSNLGVTIIYFNPLFEAKSSHKYDAASYMKIDPHFATNDEFAAFVAECHEAGIRVVMDLAFNHTGETFWAFADTREKGAASEYWDWYEWKKWPLPEGWTSGGSEYYDCWAGFGQMPNLNFDLSRANPDEQHVRDIGRATPNQALVDHLLGAVEYWLAFADVDGFRLDVAQEVPFWFWELMRERIREIKPDAYVNGELWGSSPQWVNGRYFDGVMNYKFFREPVLDFIARGRTSAEEFDRALAPGRIIYADEGVRAMMNLIGSHDTERFLTIVGGDTRRLELAVLFGMTYVGAPHIYYGDEIAMMGGRDPDCRRPFHWRWHRETKRSRIHGFHRSAIALRKAFRCFVSGDFETLVADGKAFAYLRAAPGTGGTLDVSAIVALNAGERPSTVEIPVPASVVAEVLALEPGQLATGADLETLALRDVASGKTLPVIERGDGHVVVLDLRPVSGAVLVPPVKTVDDIPAIEW